MKGNRAEQSRWLDLLVWYKAMTVSECELRANLLADYYERAFRRYCSLRDADEVSDVAQVDALAHYERGEDRLAELAKSAGLRAVGWHDAIRHLPLR